MKIAIVTIYSALNYGSYLQAFAMQKTLERLGHDVAMLDCSNMGLYKKIRSIISIREPIFYLKRFFAYKKDWEKLNITRAVDEYYDAVIVGSDEVWNINGHFEHWPQYLGEKINSANLIAYAPSIGFIKPEELINDKRFVEGIKNFDMICPRDIVTRDISLKLSNKVTERVVDPTLLVLDDWDKLVPKLKIKDKYIVYYSYLNNTPMKDYIKNFAKRNNYKIIVAGFNHKWGDKIMMVTPLEFLSLIKGAEYVFTSTFHGSVLSTIMKKKLVVRPSGQKVIDYLKMVGLECRQFVDEMEYEDFEKIALESIDYNRVRNIQRTMREKSMNILKTILQ